MEKILMGCKMRNPLGFDGYCTTEYAQASEEKAFV
jgi:hypothetical protein